MITVNTPICFGQKGRFGSYGKRVRDLSDKMLRFIIEKKDVDPMAQYVEAAKEVLACRARLDKDFAIEDDLDSAADAILKNAGYKNLCIKKRGKP